ARGGRVANRSVGRVVVAVQRPDDVRDHNRPSSRRAPRSPGRDERGSESRRAPGSPGRDERGSESRRAPGSPGRDERGGVWGAMSGPPTPIDPPTLTDVAEAFADVAAATGAGARRARDERLALLAARVSADERG